MTQRELVDVSSARLDGAGAYMARHRDEYVQWAQAAAPRLTDPDSVWDRFAFSILTANTTVDCAVRAFKLARKIRGLPRSLQMPGVTPDRYDYVNSLPLDTRIFSLLRQRGESWPVYRERVASSVQGLALTKASYSICLLYPMRADVACLDIWMLRLFERDPRLGFVATPETVWNSAQRYRLIETVCIRPLARQHGISLALAQWLLWDYVRGSRTPQDWFA